MNETHPPTALQRPSSQQHQALVFPKWLCTWRVSLRQTRGSSAFPAVWKGPTHPLWELHPHPRPARSHRTGPLWVSRRWGCGWNSQCPQLLHSAGAVSRVPVTSAGSGPILTYSPGARGVSKVPRRFMPPPARQLRPPRTKLGTSLWPWKETAPPRNRSQGSCRQPMQLLRVYKERSR